uniref:Uncharacterized protein n=1 Tax=Arundo donax TaxID=35708 RepID=A0A0A8YWJ1_ARUDO
MGLKSLVACVGGCWVVLAKLLAVWN